MTWTPQQHTTVEAELEQAWLDGYNAACRDIAAAQVELDDAWTPAGRRTHQQAVAERLALFEACATQFHATNGTREWRVP